MNVRRYPAEPDRFLVQSRSRNEIEHVVDMAYVECPGDQPRAACGCERSLIYGETCPHICAVNDFIKAQKKLTNQA